MAACGCGSSDARRARSCARCSPAARRRRRRGGGIVSTNPCADAMLVRLVAAGADRGDQPLFAGSRGDLDPAAVARRFRATAGTAEEVIALRPSLVLARSFTAAGDARGLCAGGAEDAVSRFADDDRGEQGAGARDRGGGRASGRRGEAMAGGSMRAASAPPPSARAELARTRAAARCPALHRRRSRERLRHAARRADDAAPASATPPPITACTTPARCRSRRSSRDPPARGDRAATATAARAGAAPPRCCRDTPRGAASPRG